MSRWGHVNTNDIKALISQGLTIKDMDEDTGLGGVRWDAVISAGLVLKTITCQIPFLVLNLNKSHMLISSIRTYVQTKIFLPSQNGAQQNMSHKSKITQWIKRGQTKKLTVKEVWVKNTWVANQSLRDDVNEEGALRPSGETTTDTPSLEVDSSWK